MLERPHFVTRAQNLRLENNLLYSAAGIQQLARGVRFPPGTSLLLFCSGGGNWPRRPTLGVWKAPPFPPRPLLLCFLDASCGVTVRRDEKAPPPCVVEAFLAREVNAPSSLPGAISGGMQGT